MERLSEKGTGRTRTPVSAHRHFISIAGHQLRSAAASATCCCWASIASHPGSTIEEARQLLRLSTFTILPAVSNDQHKIGNFNAPISSLSSNRNLKGQGSHRCEQQIKILLGKVKSTELLGFDQGW